MKIGYKVLRAEIVRLNRSIYMTHLVSYAAPYPCCYEEGTITGRPSTSTGKVCGPLAVFDTLRHAAVFVLNRTSVCRLQRIHIHRCEYKPSADRRLWVPMRDGYLPECSKVEFPEGTVLADEVLLLEEVDRHDYL